MLPFAHVTAEGQTTATTRLWRFRGQLRVTVIVKATFALVHQGMMKLAPSDPLWTTDIHHGNSPVRSARLTTDLAPYLPATDVLLTGHAYAPPGERAAWVTAGIGILDGYEPVLEKYLDVRGDMGPDGIQPFQKIPLVYERAFGGPGWEDNPFGVGAGGAKGEPNVFYIGERRRSAGFGPYSVHWPARKKLVSPAVRRALAEAIAEIPEGFDWTYFHAAPPDQRCPFLSGSEWLVLQGLRPDERRVRTRLPAAKGRALVFWAGEAPEGEPLELICDTLRIEPDRGVCSVTWRKSFAVAEETELADLRVLAGVEIGGQPIAWSAPGAEAAPNPGPAPGSEQAHRPSAPGIVRRARVPTLTLSEADLEVLSDEAEESAVVPDGSPGTVSGERGAPPVLVAPVAPTPDRVSAGVGPLGMGPLGVRPPAAHDSAAPAAGAPRPMILGSFRLAVFSPDYEEAPYDPLLSTLVIRSKPSPGVEPLRATVRMEEGPPSESEADVLQRTLVMKGRRTGRVETPSPVIQDMAEPFDIDDPSTTLVLRNKPSPGRSESSARGRPLGDLAGPPESTTGVLPACPMPDVSRVGLAGTIVIDDEDTEDTGPPPPELEPPRRPTR